MAIGRTLHVPGVAEAVAGSALLGGPADAWVGRVLVKPATAVRVAVVLAVTAGALAAAVAVPEIAVALDHLDPGGARAGRLSDGVSGVSWIAFATAMSVACSRNRPPRPRRWRTGPTGWRGGRVIRWGRSWWTPGGLLRRKALVRADGSRPSPAPMRRPLPRPLGIEQTGAIAISPTQ
ncbi:hypothetical protein OHA40_18500 [Nocardia sp. NBC_00508]|uniref:hypothetical protein n=1 Tax=Nocardia sp. NBC_00508 TaxID=2975992 RepID=UPI002E7FC736|nr:hypothetical protein [Nocardia sp. NBC_00508]WUD63755.1 hypothetical protein OHA40_18500 [Nocardia sp. NBC_00508]